MTKAARATLERRPGQAQEEQSPMPDQPTPEEPPHDRREAKRQTYIEIHSVMFIDSSTPPLSADQIAREFRDASDTIEAMLHLTNHGLPERLSDFISQTPAARQAAELDDGK
jgi:hypothetical protein